MKFKKIIPFLLSTAMLSANVPFVKAAQSPQIKNVIYLMPDGGGYALLDLANDVKKAGGFDSSKYPYKTPTNTNEMSLMQYLRGSDTTHSADAAITDSAAGGTVIATGYKTNNGYVGINPQMIPKATVLEGAQKVGKSTGLVTTCPWTEASPASFSSHTTTRNDELNIYQQIENQGIDVVLCMGGYSAASVYGANVQTAIDNGYKIIEDKEDMATVQPGDKLWENIETYTSDITNTSSKPTLAEMVDCALTALSGDEDGFFLMIEASHVDGGGHANNAVTTSSEYIAYDAAFKACLDFAKNRTDTVVIGVPDHDTGGMNYRSGMSSEIESIRTGTNPSSITWESGNHTARICPVFLYTPDGIDVIDGLNPVPGDSEKTRSEAHIIDNTAFAPYMAKLMGFDLDEMTKELFVDVTNIGEYKLTTERFVFNNGDKYIYKNQSCYYKDGQKIDLNGEIAVYINERFYVPASMIDEEDWNHKNEEKTDIIEGSGTLTDPYLIDSASDFMEFSTNVICGDTYSGKYIKQVTNIDMSTDMDYIGTNKHTFSGTYDGNGYTIKVNYETDESRSPFPYIYGTLMNVGIIGSIKTSGSDAVGAIARSVRSGGKIINCYSHANLTGPTVSGIAGTNNKGIISNAYFGGTLTASTSAYPITLNESTGACNNCYYIDTCGAQQTTEGVTSLTEALAANALAKNLNSSRETAATHAEVETDTILYWEEYLSRPIILPPVSKVTSVTVSPKTITIGKGDSYTFEAVADGYYNPSQEVRWYLEPSSDFDGTYITQNGEVFIDNDETAEAFTVVAKSLAAGNIAGTSAVTVGEKTILTEPDGSKEFPYIIEDEEDFYNFTNNILNGERYNEVYFKQTSDLDMSDYPFYNGMDGISKAGFYGTYDGNGHTINLAIESDSYNCLFAMVYGTIINLGTTGTIYSPEGEGGTGAGGICYYVRNGGKIVNCWSSVNITARKAGGIAQGNMGGIIANSYFCGTINADYTFPVAESYSGGSGANNYYLGTEYKASDDMTEITQTQLNENLSEWLNSSKAESASIAGINNKDLCTWTLSEIGLPIPELSNNITISISNVNYADENVTGKISLSRYSDEFVTYAALYNGNTLVAVDMPVINSTSNDFTISYAAETGAEYTVKVLLWNKTLEPYSEPAFITLKN